MKRALYPKDVPRRSSLTKERKRGGSDGGGELLYTSLSVWRD